MIQRPLFHRHPGNPILTTDDMPVSCLGVLNPGAADFDRQVVLLLRVEKPDGLSDLHVARSDNGVDGWRIDPEPLLERGLPDCPYEAWGVEDARIVYLDEFGCYYITYTAVSRFGAALALARTCDFETVERLGLIFPPNNKDGVLFSCRCDGRWRVLHRPEAGDIQHIWEATSEDLMHWGDPDCVLPEGHPGRWDHVKVGAGPPPLRTDHGWLLIYHGVKGYGGKYVYRAGAALLDLHEPQRVIHRCPHAIFQAEAPYEQTGLVPNVVFPTGLLERGDELWLYYGAADSCVALAIAQRDELMQYVLG